MDLSPYELRIIEYGKDGARLKKLTETRSEMRNQIEGSRERLAARKSDQDKE